jgi:hypothetical protein
LSGGIGEADGDCGFVWKGVQEWNGVVDTGYS